LDEIAMECGIFGKKRKIWWENVKEKEHLEDLVRDCRVILKYSLIP
jgi:hypothetical protein